MNKPIAALLVCYLSMMTAAQTPTQTADPGPARISARARAIHNSALIVDTHADTPQRFLDENFDLATTTSTHDGHMDFAKIKVGNLGAEFFSIWVEPKANAGHYSNRTLQLIDSVYQQAERHPDKMQMAFSAADITRIHAHHKFAALLGIEGGHSIENSLTLLRDFYRLGVRYMTLTWSNTNDWADSSGDTDDATIPHHDGLTPFGKDVVREMNRLGMMIDVSHVADKTFWDVIATTQAPVIASHSSARALTNHPRNMTDDMLRAVAKNGGMVQVNYYSAFIDEDYRQAYAAMNGEHNAIIDAAIKAVDDKYKDADPATRYRMHDNAEKDWAAKIPRPPFKSLIDHIDHIAKVAGVDHVGLGSDFDGVNTLPQGMDSVADLPKITQALLDRDYTAAQIKKILGGNLLRVFRQCERVSRTMQATGTMESASLKKP